MNIAIKILSMDLDEILGKLDVAISTLENEFAPVVLVTANDLAQQIKNRVIQKGETANGGLFSPYSNNGMRPFRLFDKSRSASAESKVRQIAAQGGRISYKQFREINNLETSKKNFEFTGEMWKNYGIVRSSIGGGIANISLGGLTSAAENKLIANSTREGLDITDPNQHEIDFLKESINDWIYDTLEKFTN